MPTDLSNKTARAQVVRVRNDLLRRVHRISARDLHATYMTDGSVVLEVIKRSTKRRVLRKTFQVNDVLLSQNEWFRPLARLLVISPERLAHILRRAAP